MEPTSSALKGGFLITGPSGKSLSLHLLPLLFIPCPVASCLHDQILSERGTPESSLQAPRSPQPCRGPPTRERHGLLPSGSMPARPGMFTPSAPTQTPSPHLPAGSRLPLHRHAYFLGFSASSEAAGRKDWAGTGSSCQCLFYSSSCFARFHLLILHCAGSWFLRGLSSSRCEPERPSLGARASGCGDLSRRGARAPGTRASAVAARGLRRYGSQGLEHDSVTVVPGLSCSKARGILPDQGSSRGPLCRSVSSSALKPPGKGSPPVLILVSSRSAWPSGF